MPGARERALGVARVELAVEVAVLHRRRRDPEVVVELVADPLDGGERHQPRPHRLGDGVRHVAVHAHRELRRVGGLRELVQRLAHRHGLRVHEVERVPGKVVVRQVRDVVHRPRHEVHRHDVRLAALRAGQRHPLRERVAQPLEQLEEVVGAVDLVHLAGLGVADDDAGAEDERLGLDAGAHQALGLVLGPVVVVGQPLPLVEHVLLEDAAVLAGHRDRAGVVEAAHLVRVRELDHVARAVHVRPLRGLLVGLHVVHRGEVEEVVDRLVEALDPQPGLGQVAGHRHDPSLGSVEALHERVELAARALAHQHVDGALALEELGHQVPSDEAGGPGHEVVQVPSTLPSWTAARESIPDRTAGAGLQLSDSAFAPTPGRTWPWIPRRPSLSSRRRSAWA